MRNRMGGSQGAQEGHGDPGERRWGWGGTQAWLVGLQRWGTQDDLSWTLSVMAAGDRNQARKTPGFWLGKGVLSCLGAKTGTKGSEMGRGPQWREAQGTVCGEVGAGESRRGGGVCVGVR